MIANKLKKVSQLCEKVLTADEISIYEINLDYLIDTYITCAPPEDLYKLRSIIRYRILDGQSPRFVGLEIMGTEIFNFTTFEIFNMVYMWTIDTISTLIDMDSELGKSISDALLDNGKYDPKKYGNNKYIEFLNNRKQKLDEIKEIIKTNGDML